MGKQTTIRASANLTPALLQCVLQSASPVSHILPVRYSRWFQAIFKAADLHFVAQGPVSVPAAAAAHPERNQRATTLAASRTYRCCVVDAQQVGALLGVCETSFRNNEPLACARDFVNFL
jgi:hypothetical protein